MHQSLAQTSTLTTNVITVIAGSVGIHAKFAWKLDDNQTCADGEEEFGI